MCAMMISWGRCPVGGGGKCAALACCGWGGVARQRGGRGQSLASLDKGPVIAAASAYHHRNHHHHQQQQPQQPQRDDAAVACPAKEKGPPLPKMWHTNFGCFQNI